MAFPVGPSNGALTTINGTVYVYNSTNGSWAKQNVGAVTVTNDLTINGTLTENGNLSVSGSLIPSSSFQRNVIINGNMGVWQRGTSSAGSYPTYLADRWMNYRSVAGSTFSRQVTGDTTNLPNIQYCQRIQRDSGNTSTAAIYISQPIETVNSIPFVGGSVTISFYARAGANFSAASGNINIEVAYGTGTDQNLVGGFTGQAYAVATTKTLTTTWQRFTATGTVTATATQLGINLYYIPVGTASAADYMDITGVQLERGSIATPYEYVTYSEQLAQCQRYFNRLINGVAQNVGIGNWIALGSATTGYGFLYYPPMKASPTPTITAGSINFYAYIGTSSSVALSIPSNGVLSLTGTGTGWPSGGQGGVMLSGSATSLIIDLASEL